MKLRLLFLFVLCVPVIAMANYFESDMYFGLSKDNGKIISNKEFNKFENKVIIKNFKSGFTVEKGQGEWLSKKEGIIVEPSRIFVVVYKATLLNQYKIKLIANKYKKLFNQESVLVITKPVNVNFY